MNLQVRIAQGAAGLGVFGLSKITIPCIFLFVCLFFVFVSFPSKQTAMYNKVLKMEAIPGGAAAGVRWHIFRATVFVAKLVLPLM